jgi:hypothetical protein
LYLAGVHIRRNSAISIHNAIFAGWPIGLLIDDTRVVTNRSTYKECRIQIESKYKYWKYRCFLSYIQYSSTW